MSQEMNGDIGSLPVLPDGWTWTPVERLTNGEPRALTDGPFGSNLKTEHYTDSGPRVIRLQNVGDRVFLDARAHISTEHYERLKPHDAQAGDIVLASLGERLPRACLVPEDLGPAIVKADCPRLRPHPEHNAAFLMLALNSSVVRVQARHEIQGVGRPRLNLRSLKKLLVPVPSRREQDRIVAKVGRILGQSRHTADSLKTALRDIEVFEAAVLHDAFDPRDENGEASTGWEAKALAELGSWCGGGTPSKGKPEYWEGGDVPWISPKDMKTIRLTGTQDRITERAVAESSAKSFPADSIAMVVRSGILSRTLPVALVPFRATANQDMRVLSPSEGLNPEWVLGALRAHAEPIRSSCQKDGTTVASIDVPRMQGYVLRVPPRDDQDRIVAEVEDQLGRAREAADRIREALANIERFEAAVLRDAFSGQLVAQDPATAAGPELVTECDEGDEVDGVPA